MSGSSLRRQIAQEAEVRELGQTIRDLAALLTDERIGRAIVNGRVNLNQATGVVPAANMAFIDHDHNGDPRHGQKLAEANTHEGVTLGDDPGAIHWTHAALVALILATAPPGVTTLDGLSDVEIVSPVPGQVLVYYVDGIWRNTSPEAAITPGSLTIGGLALTIGGDILTVGG